MKKQQLVLIHPIDPRGSKVGGIETHLRLLMSHFPADFSLLLIGVDGIGDLPIGQLTRIETGGQQIDFLPVMHYSDKTARHATKKLTNSLPFRFALALMRHFPAIRRLAGRMPSTADLQRFEFAPFARLLGLKAVQVVHGEGRKDQKMDSLIRKYWFIQQFNERTALRLAAHILCVNPNIKKRLEKEFPAQAPKAEVMTVSVDDRNFAPAPFEFPDDKFRLVFTGRLDAFKDPGLMFTTIKKLGEKLAGKVEFHYVGTSDPHRHEEFAAIEHLSVCHGFQDARGVARILRQVHAGIITSYFEGMPCFMLETLSSGRPMGCIHLPQYELIIKPGEGGFFAERGESMEESAERLADGFAALWQDIKAGKISPRKVHDGISPFTIENQMPKIFDIHRRLLAARQPQGSFEADAQNAGSSSISGISIPE